MRRAARALACGALAALACTRAAPADPAATLLGGERGLDHVGVGVRDLAAARRTLEALGFGAAEEGKLPNGIANLNAYFEDSTYLELLTAWDAEKARWLADFTAAREGTVFLSLAVRSTEATSAFLARRGIKTGAPIPGRIQTARDPDARERWRTMFFEGAPLPASPLFFIAYAQPERAETLRKLEEARRSGRIYRHPNGALGVKGAWLAVPDLEAAARSFEAVGLPAGRAFEEPRLGARGRVVAAGEGSILLVAPASPQGAVASLLRERGGPALLGLSVEVARLGVAQRFAARATGQAAPPGRGALGTSAWVPPAAAHGAWLELFEGGR